MYKCYNCGKDTTNEPKHEISLCDNCKDELKAKVEWENEQFQEDDIVCPWCGSTFSDYDDKCSVIDNPYEATDETKVVCPDCGKHFMLEIVTKLMYTTKRPEEDFDYVAYKKESSDVVFDYHGCEHFLSEDIGGRDVFDHPSYKCYCTRNGEKKELLIPDRQCARCMENRKGAKDEK